MITVCFTYFKSLTLASFAAALYSVRKQRLEDVKEIVIIDNDTGADTEEMKRTVEDLHFPVPYRLLSYRHSDPSKTHAWSSNAAISEATTSWILFCRADYILDFGLLSSFEEVLRSRPTGWRGFITGNVYHLGVDVARCEQENWREYGAQVLRALPGVEESYTHIDAGVWMARREDFERVGGLDERLTAWGHAQTKFQFELSESGVDFVRIPRPLFFHPQHAAHRDLALAHLQLAATGSKLRDMWDRYEGRNPY